MQVNALVEFLMENVRELFEEETSGLGSPPAEESAGPTERSGSKRRDRGLSQAGAGDTRNLRVVSGGAGHQVLSSQPRLSRGLSLATASQGTNALLSKTS